MRWIVTALLTVAALAAAGPLLPGRPVRAGTAVRMELGDLAQRCELAVEGRVLARQARRAHDGAIETVYTLRVARTLRGTHRELLNVRLPGGVLPDGSGLLIAGLPELAVGEDLLLFLTPESAQGRRVPVGLAQGRLRVVTLPDGRRRLLRDQRGLELASGALVRPADGLAVFDYAPALAQIEAALAARRARETGGR